jgi:hypothetical protein
MEVERELVRALDELHRAAGRPTPRRLSRLIAEGPYPDLVSHETVRRTLKGERIPGWDKVRSIVAALATSCSPPRDADAEVGRFLPLWRAVREGERGALPSGREFVLADGWGDEDGEWTATAVAGAVVNPIHAIEIDPALASPHPPILSEDEWVQANLRVIEDFGAEFFLRALLRTLKGGYLGAERGAPFGYRNREHEVAEARDAFAYVCERIRRRLRAEPNLLPRSIKAFHADVSVGQEERDEILRAEADESLMREILTLTPDTWEEVSEEAHWLVFAYLVKEGTTLGGPDLPPDRRFQITWRVPEP